jgi:Tol biopolymer transport system component
VGWRTFPTDFITQLHITKLESGVTETIAGGGCGGNAVWSPEGDRMAFDGLCDVPFGIHVGPSRGDERRLIRRDAFHPDWSPDGRRLVFVAAQDLSLRTIDLKTGRERVLGSFGVRPRTIYFHSETRTPTTGHPLLEELHVWQMSASGRKLRDLSSETGMGVDVASW